MERRITLHSEDRIEIQNNSTIRVIIDTGITRTLCICAITLFIFTVTLLIIMVEWKVVVLVPAVMWVCSAVMFAYIIYTGKTVEVTPDNVEIGKGDVTVEYNKRKFRLRGIDIRTVEVIDDTVVRIVTRGAIKGITLRFENSEKAKEVKDMIGK